MILADVHQPDEAALLVARNRKYGSKHLTIELPVTHPASPSVVHFSPARPVHRRLDEARFQMAGAITIRADCVVSWNNPPPLEIIANPNVPRVPNICCLAIS
jgi:hypothetical protein